MRFFHNNRCSSSIKHSDIKISSPHLGGICLAPSRTKFRNSQYLFFKLMPGFTGFVAFVPILQMGK
jgi:hypothetical protein